MAIERKKIISYGFFVAFGTVMYILSNDFANDDTIAMNPAFYPRMMIALILFVTVLLVIYDKNPEKTNSADALDSKKTGDDKPVKQWLVQEIPVLKFYILLLLYALGLKILGFVIPTLILLFAGMHMLGCKRYSIMGSVTLIITFSIYFSFSYLLKVRFPSGILFGGA